MTEKEVLSRLQQLCSRQEKCIYDIKMKLTEWKIGDKQATEIIRDLIANRFIDEMRYANSFVNDKFRLNSWGKIKITYALRVKGIDKNIIEQAIKQINEKIYKDSLTEIIKKKRKSIKDKDKLVVGGKLFRYAISKGFETDIVTSVVKSVVNDERINL